MNEYISNSQKCPNNLCRHYEKTEQENVVIHDKKRNRYRCKSCGKTWVGHCKEVYFGLRTSPLKIQRALEMLKAGLTIRQVAELTKVSPSTIMRWKKRSHYF